MTTASLLNRRGFLTTTASLLGSAAAFGPLSAWAGSVARTDRCFPAGFLGDRSLLVIVENGILKLPAPFPVPAHWGPVPDPTSRYGGLGLLNGTQVHFSGGRNKTEPRLATPWAEIEAGSINPAFSPTDETAGVPADLPETWEVFVDGRPVGVTAVTRKTVPLRGAEIGMRQPVHETRHLVTLDLDVTVPTGAQVELRAPLAQSITVTRNPSVHSELIHVCQAGYAHTGPKRGFVGQWLGHDATGTPRTTDGVLSENTPWRLLAEPEGRAVIGGSLIALPEAELDGRQLTGCRMYEADFSEYSVPGHYRLAVEGLGASFPFEIGAQPCRDALRLAARWYYYKRSGIARADPFAEGYPRPRNGHPEDGLVVWQSDVRLSATSEGLGGPYAPRLMRDSPYGGPTPAVGDVPRLGQANPAAWGGWHDAGDWDVRAQHLEVVYTMAWLVETLPVAATLELNLPESGKSFSDPAVLSRVDGHDLGDGKTVLPDLIHEALWGLSLWRRTQRPDGGIIGGVEFSQVGIKGSYSWDPVERAYAYAPDPWSGYLFAAGAAKLGHVIAHDVGDRRLGGRLISEAQRAWDWAEAQGAARDILPDEETIPQDVGRIWQSRIAAASTIYRTTGDPVARAIFERANPFGSELGATLKLKRGVYVAQALDYCLAGREGRPVDALLCEEITEWVRMVPQRDLHQRLSRHFGLHVSSAYPWGRGWLRFGPGSNWPAQRIALAMSVMEGSGEDLKDRVTEGMWFALGCNPSNVSFVQGLGARQFADPLLLDRPYGDALPGYPVFGVAGGALHPWEKERTQGAIYPAAQDDWPLYAQIFESRYVAICAEHGMKSNALEWLVGCAAACQLEAA